MSAKKASDHYLGRNGAVRLNCAQSVAAVFSSDTALLNELASCGAGRAPNGWCGAAYAAARLTGNGALVEERYKAQAGSVHCGEIRKGRKLSCVGCVELGASVVAQNSPKA